MRTRRDFVKAVAAATAGGFVAQRGFAWAPGARAEAARGLHRPQAGQGHRLACASQHRRGRQRREGNAVRAAGARQPATGSSVPRASRGWTGTASTSHCSHSRAPCGTASRIAASRATSSRRRTKGRPRSSRNTRTGSSAWRRCRCSFRISRRKPSKTASSVSASRAAAFPPDGPGRRT